LAGGALKEVGTGHWNDPNIGATNSSGFTAFPGGIRLTSYGSPYQDIIISGYFWTKTELIQHSVSLLILKYIESDPHRSFLILVCGILAHRFVA